MAPPVFVSCTMRLTCDELVDFVVANSGSRLPGHRINQRFRRARKRFRDAPL